MEKVGKTTLARKVIDAAKSIEEENGEDRIALKLLAMIMVTPEKMSSSERAEAFQLIEKLAEKINPRKPIFEVLEKEKKLR